MFRLLQANRIGFPPPKRQLFCGVLALFALMGFGFFSSVHATTEALVIVGLTGSETDQETLFKTAAQCRTGLLQRGLKPAAVTVLGAQTNAKVSRESILKALQPYPARLQATDEFWLILLGHSGRADDGQPAFQVRGPRLTASDLQGALRGIKARQIIFIGTEFSGGYIPALKNAQTCVITATDAEGEINQPRFPEKWAQALNENPGWSPAQISARASQLVEKEFDSEQLAQGEHAKLYEPVSGKILSAPFGVTDFSVALATRPNVGGMTPVQPSDIDIPKDKQRYHHEPATAETKALLTEAKRAPNPDGHPALIMLEGIDYTVNSDFSTVEEHQLRVSIVSEEAVDQWAFYNFPNSPGAVTTKISLARVILPDGSSNVMNIDNVCDTADTGTCSSCGAQVLLPEVHAGCVVEISYRIEARTPGSLPFFYEELPLQHNVPVLKSSMALKLPKKGKYKYRLKNTEAAPVLSETDAAQVIKWNFPTGLPAFESLPYDPPTRDMLTVVQLGSTDTWNDFISWYRRIAKDSDKSGPEIVALAKELSRDHPKRQQKLKAAFEYVSKMRYVAIEFGVHGFRPRTPTEVLANRYGDCKDKATLLAVLLREMGIPAQFALINRMSSTDADFPGWQFNHAITYVPPAPDQGQKDGFWLDTTDTATPFGFIAPGNLGRTALVLPPNQTGGQFLPVTDPNQSISTVRETWEWTQDATGRWTGTLKKEWGGLSDYTQRLRLKSLTPAQRQFFLQQALTEEALGVDFTQLALSDVTNLATPVLLTARVSGADLSCTSLGVNLFSMMAAPTRNRAMVLNDGQPMAFTRISHFVYAKPVAERKDTKPIAWEGGGLKLDFQQRWTNERTFEQIEKIELTTPTIATADYAATRTGLQQWLQQTRSAKSPLP